MHADITPTADKQPGATREASRLDDKSRFSHPHPPRFLGHAASPDGRYTRVVERATLMAQPIDFKSLCQRVLSDQTRYLILDLDRTTHRARNLGELLGWEIAAYRVYGEQAQARLETLLGRVLWDRENPLSLVGYFAEGVRTWAFPGLSYLLWGKLTTSVDALERWSYRKFGLEPIQAVQRLPQTALLHKLATLPQSTLRMLAQRVWERCASEQVIQREDLEWVRQRCPGIKIIITSASPKPMLEVAGEALGVDAIEYSSTSEHGDSFSAPFWVDRRFVLGGLERIAPPEQVRINSGHRKIERLLERYPDLADPRTESVGVSDTGYGEDHAWAQYLSVVVDVNSTASFPPVVAFDSPLREVFSAKLLTRQEREQGGHAQDVRAIRYEHAELAELLASDVQQLEQLARRYHGTAQGLASLLEQLEAQEAQANQAISQAVERYNEAHGLARPMRLQELRSALRAHENARRALTRAASPLSLQKMGITRALRRARAQLDRAFLSAIDAQ